MKKIKVNLLALTGFGNAVFKTLLDLDVNVLKIYTRKEVGKFPYYDEEQLDRLAERTGVPVSFVSRNGDWVIGKDADLNLVATFHRILHKKHMEKAKLNINIHPSLLPSYRGPTPTNWIIYNREKKCGITAHFLTDKVDSGDIIYQKEFPLSCETDADLRKFLAEKSRDAVSYIVRKYPNYEVIKSNYKDTYYESYYKFINNKDK